LGYVALPIIFGPANAPSIFVSSLARASVGRADVLVETTDLGHPGNWKRTTASGQAAHNERELSLCHNLSAAIPSRVSDARSCRHHPVDLAARRRLAGCLRSHPQRPLILTTNLADLFLLDPTVTFLNHGSFGACPRPVFEEYQRWQLELERQPVEFLDSRRGLPKRLQVVREAMAQEFGTSVDNIAAVTNATGGLNVVAQSIPLEPGDEILTTDHEYASLEKTWAYVCRKTGAKVVEVTVPLPPRQRRSMTPSSPRCRSGPRSSSSATSPRRPRSSFRSRA
jgi:hypothetical protein